MASIHSYRGRRGTTYRVFWRTSDGVQHTQTFPSKAEAREWRATVERFEAAGQTPDPTRGDIRLEMWAGQVIATLRLKPKTAETYASLLRRRILPTSAKALESGSCWTGIWSRDRLRRSSRGRHYGDARCDRSESAPLAMNVMAYSSATAVSLKS